MVAQRETPWLARLSEVIERGPGEGSTLVVAVSGGGDSVALLHGLIRVRKALALTLVVAHLDHGLRAESAADAAFVGQLALDQRLLCVREQRNVADQLAREGGNLEALARQVRYQFLDEVATAVGAAAVLTGHTQDDQAETLLMNLFRGAGLDGLTAMDESSPSPHPGARAPLLRPLLGVERRTLRDWLREEGIQWREDQTNDDLTRLRAHVRQELLPTIETRFPQLRTRLAQSASLLRDEQRWLEGVVDAIWRLVAQPEPTGVHLDRTAFLGSPIAVQRRLLRRAVFSVAAEGAFLGGQHVAEALALAERGHSGQRASLPGGLFLFVEREHLWVGAAPPPARRIIVEAPLHLPGEGRVTSAGLVVEIAAVGREAIPEQWSDLPPHAALLDADHIRWPMTLRPPAPGERWQPLGMDGADVGVGGWLARHGVPAAQRGRQPVLVDGSGEVVWLVGEQVGHHARIRATTERMWRVIVHSVAPSHTLLETP